MAPRRLIIAMLLLLTVSTALAILTPNPRREDSGAGGESPRQEAERRPEGPPAAGRERPGPGPRSEPGRTIVRRLEDGERTEQISARPGDRLVLELTTRRAGSFEVSGAGLIAWADRWAPARFDVLVEGGDERLEIRRVGSGDPVAVVRVR